ncbi:MAG: hypothetical protein ACYC4Q_11450 [Victivallaceae bacterium]
MRKVSILFTMCATMSMIGCATGEYITPNIKEYTTGGIFADKYWSSWSGGKNVRLEGTCSNMTTSVLNGEEQALFQLAVPGGLRPVNVYADRKFAAQIYELAGRNVVVYGKTLSVQSHSREDQGFTGAELSVDLKQIELAKQGAPVSVPVSSPATEQKNCPPSGTEVPFARLVNPAFNADYVGCKVATTARFMNIKTGMVTLPASVTDTHVIFNAADTNETTQSYVAMQKQAADLLFELKPKDLIKITGENRLARTGALEVCFFDAESVIRAQ